MSSQIIDDLGGTSAVAEMCHVRPASVSEWRSRGIPADRAPFIEAGSGGKYHCERVCPGAAWARIPDKRWRWHRKGRPVLDVSKAVA